MNFHIFVLLTTVVFYILMKIYKKSLHRINRTKRSSNLIYVLFVPLIMYLYHFMYVQKDNIQTSNIQMDNIKITVPSESVLPSESLLTSPFPESSVSVGSSSNMS